MGKGEKELLLTRAAGEVIPGADICLCLCGVGHALA